MASPLVQFWYSTIGKCIGIHLEGCLAKDEVPETLERKLRFGLSRQAGFAIRVGRVAGDCRCLVAKTCFAVQGLKILTVVGLINRSYQKSGLYRQLGRGKDWCCSFCWCDWRCRSPPTQYRAAMDVGSLGSRPCGCVVSETIYCSSMR